MLLPITSREDRLNDRAWFARRLELMIRRKLLRGASRKRKQAMMAEQLVLF
jgi:hypothetical protein